MHTKGITGNAVIFATICLVRCPVYCFICLWVKQLQHKIQTKDLHEAVEPLSSSNCEILESIELNPREEIVPKNFEGG